MPNIMLIFGQVILKLFLYDVMHMLFGTYIVHILYIRSLYIYVHFMYNLCKYIIDILHMLQLCYILDLSTCTRA